MPLRGNGIQPQDIIQVGPEGAILVGGARMCLIEIVGGFQTIKSAIQGRMGDGAADVFYDAGVQGAKVFVDTAMKQGILSRDSVGFRKSVAAYTRAGFGGFKVTHVNFSKRTARVHCGTPMAFEAFAVAEDGKDRHGPVCDYSRGVIASFMIHLSGDENVHALETACRADGAERCQFVVEPIPSE